MKLFRRPAAPLHTFTILPAPDWTVRSFYLWQTFLADAGVPVPSALDYELETTVAHYLALTNAEPRAIIGSLQLVTDHLDRYHLHRLIVAPAWRNGRVASELARAADFNHDQVDLWAHCADDHPLTSLLDTFLFMEQTDAKEPRTFLVGATAEDHAGDEAGAAAAGPDQGVSGAPGAVGDERPALDGAGPPQGDPGHDHSDSRRARRRRRSKGGDQ